MATRSAFVAFNCSGQSYDNCNPPQAPSGPKVTVGVSGGTMTVNVTGGSAFVTVHASTGSGSQVYTFGVVSTSASVSTSVLGSGTFTVVACPSADEGYPSDVDQVTI